MHVHVMTIHEHRTILNVGTHYECTANYGHFTQVTVLYNFVRNVAHAGEIFRSRPPNFQIRKISANLKANY